MDAELRDAERAAAGGDPIEAERLAGLRARGAIVLPPRRGQTADRAERERLNAIVQQRAAARDNQERATSLRAELVAEEVQRWLALPSRERASRDARRILESFSRMEVEARGHKDAAWTAWLQAVHGWTRATFGTCPIEPTKHGKPCGGKLGPDGRCTVCPDACGCDGCSGAL